MIAWVNDETNRGFSKIEIRFIVQTLVEPEPVQKLQDSKPRNRPNPRREDTGTPVEKSGLRTD